MLVCLSCDKKGGWVQTTLISSAARTPAYENNVTPTVFIWDAYNYTITVVAKSCLSINKQYTYYNISLYTFLRLHLHTMNGLYATTIQTNPPHSVYTLYTLPKLMFCLPQIKHRLVMTQFLHGEHHLLQIAMMAALLHNSQRLSSERVRC